MLFAILMKHLKFIFSIFKDSRLLQNAKKGSAAAYMDLELWQMKATWEDQLLQQCSVTSKMTAILEYTSAKISELSNVLTRGCSKNWNINKICKMTNGPCMDLQ
jgi:Fic family protein